jgi:ABC-2 type transport system ATP-binding protein
MDKNVLEVKNLVKNYGSYTAVNNISFNVQRGKIIGLLGPNGAGKTTTIQVLLGVTLHNGGEIKYFGKDFTKNRQHSLQRINFTSSFNTLQGRISVFENLLVFAHLYQVQNPRKKISEFAQYFEITDLLNKTYWNLSAGQKTRVNLIKSLLNNPELILMDEPTASLDPDIADKTLQLIEKLNKEDNVSILYTSHDMEEVTRICDEVIFLDHGKIVAKDTPLGLTKMITHSNIILSFDADRKIVESFLKEKGYEFTFPRKFTVKITVEEKLIPKVIFGLGEKDIWITDIEVNKPTLENVFLEITRRGKHANK